MTINDLIKIYETKKKKYGVQAYRHISNVLKEAKELHKKDFSESEKNKEKISKGGIPEKVEEIKVLKDEKMADVLLRTKTVESKGEWRRLVLAGGVSNAETDEKITSPDELVKDITLKVGKKRFIKLVLEQN